MTVESAKFGHAGIAIGAVALLLALVHFWAGPFTPKPTLEETVATKAAAIKEATIAALRGEEPEPEGYRIPPMDTDRILALVTALLGGAAIILGVVGLAGKEPLRVAAGAAMLGGGAIAFQFAVVALSVLVVAILVGAVLSGMDFG